MCAIIINKFSEEKIEFYKNGIDPTNEVGNERTVRADSACLSWARLPLERRAAMGQKAQEKMEREFDRQRVVDDYMEEVKRALLI